MNTKLLIGIPALVLLAACTARATPTPAQQVDIANPASAYCVEQGYRSEIRTANDGGQSGVCIFPDGSECDEWTYFRGECGPANQTPSPDNPPPKTWVNMFEGPNYGAFFDVILTDDGNILVTGATNHLHMPPYSGDALFMKLSIAGDVLWERTWGGDGYDQADSVVPAGEGGYYIFGETDSYGAGNRDFFLLKITKDGEEEWYETYGGPGREWPYGMLSLSNGDLLLYGFTETVGGGRDEYAIRVAQDGSIIWEYTVENPSEELVLDALETPEGNLVLAVGVDEDGGLVKLDTGGKIVWTQRYELPGWQYASQIAETDDGGFLLTGFSMSPNRQADTWLARCTATGELVWETSFGEATFDDYANSMIRLSDGTYLIGAIANGVLLSRVDEDGTVLWRRSLLDPQTVYGGMALAELEDGGYLVAGLIELIGGRSYDALILRTDTEGRVGE